MNTRSLVTNLSLAVGMILLISNVSFAPPPARVRTLPGVEKGQLESRWLSPYVLVRTERIGSASTTSVRWFKENGKLIHELSGQSIYASPGFVSDAQTIHAVNGDWKFVLPKKPGPAGYITATTDSRTFLHEFHPQERQVAVDIYIRGKLANTVGPFHQYRAESVQLSGDGSAAILVWRGAEQKRLQVVVTGPDGKTRFQRDCIAPAHAPVAAPGANGALVKPNTGDAKEFDFVYYPKAGKSAPFHVGSNAKFVDWVPDSTKVLISSSVGEAEHFHLVQCTTGETVWSIPDPNPRPGMCCAAIAVKKYILFHGHDFAAVDSETGRMIARWKPDGHRRPIGVNGAWFRKLGKKFFVVADNEFAEARLEDIAAKKNGWR